jgi:hypothetical protein
MDPFWEIGAPNEDRFVLVDATALDEASRMTASSFAATTEQPAEVSPAMITPPVGPSCCCICFDCLPHDNEPRQGCSGTTETAPHYLCSDCEVAYLRAELSPGHAFDSQRYMGGDLGDESAIISQPGQLPCPQFITGNCDCAALSFAGLCGSLRTNPDVAELYQTAFRRAVEAQTRQESKSTYTNETNESESSEPSETVLDVHRSVRTKLDEASMMKCPTCGYPGLKDHACMHITCEEPACSTRWCYACGRHRMRNNHPDDCRGCDAVSAQLERQQALMPRAAYGVNILVLGPAMSFIVVGWSISYSASNKKHPKNCGTNLKRPTPTC